MTEYVDPGLGDEWEAPPGGSFHWPYDGPRKVTVRNARFTASTFDDNNTILVLDCIVDDPNIPEKEFEYKVGKVEPDGLQSLDGENLQSAKGGYGTRNQFYAKFVHEVTHNAAFAPFVAWLKANGGSPIKASTWVGHTFMMEAKEFTFGGDVSSAIRAWPIEWLGHGAEVAVPEPTGLVGGAAATPEAAAPAAPAASNGDLTAQLQSLAVAAAGDIAKFRTEASRLELDSATMLSVLTDESYFAQLVTAGS